MNIHKAFIFTVFLLTGFGLIMVASASAFQARVSFGDWSHLFFRQLLYGIGIGSIAFLGGYLTPLRLIKKAVVPFLFFSILLLIAVFIPGVGLEYGGAHRWIGLAHFSFQPSEFAKLALIFYSSSWLASHKKRLREFTTGFLPFLVLSTPIPLLILLEPNLSNFVISVSLILILLFIAGGRVIHLVGLGIMAALLLLGALLFLPTRFERVLTLLNPSLDPQGASYQINQSLIALGSGGVFGKGLGRSSQKSGFLPEPAGDSIFAIIGEEFGFVGTSILLSMYLLFVLEGIIIAIRSADPFSSYLTLGFSAVVGLQAFINVSAVSGLVPVTGVTLPFVSYGSTSLASLLATSGVVAQIARRSV